MSLDISLMDAGQEVYHINITHNMRDMAIAANVYRILWHPVDSGVISASDLRAMILPGFYELIGNPLKYKEHDPSNGWGSYDDFVLFIFEVIIACGHHPYATVDVSI